jgi:signal transduction histidine kinase
MRSGVISLDPKKSIVPVFKPSVHLIGFSADDRPYPLRPEVSVPARTNRLQFLFTAVDLVSPQRLTFRYRLVGLESEWHDTGVERAATYTGLRPGTYRFEVLASNDGKVWSDPRPILIVHLNPAWNQTKMFHIVVALAGISFAILVLTFERERHEKSLRMAFNARTAERTRLARQLHDTLLQTLQGSNLIAEHASETVNSVPEARRILGLLKDWLTRADAEGRAVLDVLREETTEENIEGALQVAIDQIPLCSGMVTIRTHQRPRPIHPGISDDILQICLEAVRNACIHSQSPTVKVDLYFERVFAVEIKDEGIGFDSVTKPVKRAGHYGLAGMRERAAEIHGTLAIESSAQTGTRVQLTIPGKYVYSPLRAIVCLQWIWQSLWG